MTDRAALARLTRERADVDALLVAAEERLAEVERERDEAKNLAQAEMQGNTENSAAAISLRVKLAEVERERAETALHTKGAVDALLSDRDSLRGQVEAMRHLGAAVELFRKDGRLNALFRAHDAYRSATAAADPDYRHESQERPQGYENASTDRSRRDPT